jgi:hypothetical protein
MDNMIEVLREGDFRPGQGWKGRIGWTYGGRTIQGILPYYYFIEAPRLDPQPHRELERCRYNNMVQLPKCKQKSFDNVTANHFTGDCVKPWYCQTREHHLCQRFVTQWFKIYRKGLREEPLVRGIVDSQRTLLRFAEEKEEGCGRSGFVSLAHHL